MNRYKAYAILETSVDVAGVSIGDSFTVTAQETNQPINVYNIHPGRGQKLLELSGTIPYNGFPAVRVKVWLNRDGRKWLGIDLWHLDSLEEKQSLDPGSREYFLERFNSTDVYENFDL